MSGCEARDRADRVAEGRFDLLGYHDLALGSPPDWHTDAVHARRAPGGFWDAIPYLDPSSGDHKIIWELNRHQHFAILGTAYWLTGERRYRDVFVVHLEDWLRANPPLDGINWSSMLELAFRCLSWAWAVEFFSAGASGDDTPYPVKVRAEAQLRDLSRKLATPVADRAEAAHRKLLARDLERYLERREWQPQQLVKAPEAPPGMPIGDFSELDE